MHIDPDFYRVVAVQKVEIPTIILLTLENMKGEQRTKQIVFDSDIYAQEFYIMQSKMLENKKKR